MQDARNPVTLATLDAMPEEPLPALRPVALKDCTMPQLEVLHDRFGELISLHERMSGACAAMQGLVLTEIKHKIGHGKWLPWLQAHYKKSPRSAQDYMRLAEKFVAEAKYAEPCVFAALTNSAGDTLAQIEAAKLDLNHPTVAAVVKWSEGKSAHQLLLNLEPCRKGGNTYDRDDGKGDRKPLSPDAAKELLQTMCRNAAQHLATVFSEHAYAMLSEAELAGLLNHCETVAEAVRNWQRLTSAQRAEQLAAFAKK